MSLVDDISNLVQILRESSDESQKLSELVRFENLCKKLLPYAEKFCYKDVKANGIWTTLKMGKRMLECFIREGLTEEQLRKYQKALNFFNLYLDNVLKTAEYSEFIKAKDPDSKEPFLQLTQLEYCGESAEQLMSMVEEYYNLPELREACKLIHTEYADFWFDERLRKVCHCVRLSFIFLRFGPLTTLMSILSKEKYTKALSDLVTYRCAFFPSPIQRAFLYYGGKLPAMLPYARDIFEISFNIHSKNQYVIDSSSSLILKTGNRKSNAINSRLLYSQGTQPKTLILHIHGGGLILGDADTDAVFILRDWCRRLPGVAILSVNYTCLKPLRIPVQEVLDFYIWLTEGDDVKEKLGFVPEKIILCGESIGCLLSLILVLALNDIETQFGVQVQKPSALVCISGFLNSSFNVTPSRILCSLDPIVQIPVAHLLHGIASGWFEDQEAKVILEKDGIMASFLHKIKNIFGYYDDRPWFLKSMENQRLMHRYCNRVLSARYASPLYVPQLRDIQVPLYILCAEFCVSLDESVTLASIWKGPVKLDFLPDVHHAFLHINKACKATQCAYEQVFKRLEEAVSL